MPKRLDLPLIFAVAAILLILAGELSPLFVAHGDADNRLANYTLWLMVFTGLLALVSATQIFFLIRTDKTARITAEATKLSADAAVAVSLPVVYLSQIYLIEPPDPATGRYQREVTNAIPPKLSFAKLIFRNYGRSPARLSQIFAQHKVCEELPPEPFYVGGENLPNGTVIESQGDGFIIESVEKFRITGAEQSAIADGTAYLWVYGFLGFRDLLGSRHETRFCFRWWSVDPGVGSDSPPGLFEDGPESYRRST